MPSERCGFTPDLRGGPKLGRICCWRPVYADAERCIWHADRGDRSVVELAEHRPHPGERLDCAQLGGLTLTGVDWFSDAVLVGADFTDTNVDGATFDGADLRKANFEGTSARGTSFRDANLEGADIDSVDLRAADLRLARADDTDVSGTRINSETALGVRSVYDIEMEESDGQAKADALEAAVRTYREFESLSQDNSLYDQASRFYRRSKDVRRRYNWEVNKYASALGAELSRLSTGYGNQPWRVLTTAFAVIVFSALLYPIIGGLRSTASPRTVFAVSGAGSRSPGVLLDVFLRSLFFSVLTFTTLGYGNLEPASTLGRQVAGVEALVGSLILALLVAVLTRSTWLR